MPGQTSRIQSRLIGSHYEGMAEDYLKRQGMKFVTRNYLCKSGEIDLIMLDKDYLVFVEVRYRNDSSYGSAIETISSAKLRKLVRTARFYLANNLQYKNHPCRFDVVGIDNTADGKPLINWIKNAIME